MTQKYETRRQIYDGRESEVSGERTKRDILEKGTRTEDKMTDSQLQINELPRATKTQSRRRTSGCTLSEMTKGSKQEM